MANDHNGEDGQPIQATGSPQLEPQESSLQPDNNWEHIDVFKAVQEALLTLPSSFKSDLIISGVAATDLFTFNTSLGASIEAQVVRALNETRSIWDPHQKYQRCTFVRQSQRFPDVILRDTTSREIIMGIELKGWYVLAKEREPSFRYVATPAVCAPADLLVVFPWALANVVSGTPQLFQPYIISARFAALYRNWHWQFKMTDRISGNRSIVMSSATTQYPLKSDPIDDMPKRDKGGNFGRFARTNLMDQYISELYREELSGIPLGAWQRFLSLFAEDKTEDALHQKLERMAVTHKRNKLGGSNISLSTATVQGIVARLEELANVFESG